MTKQEYMTKYGFTLRRVTPQDRATARTDYQRRADYIIGYKGTEWYSMGGSMRDMFAMQNYYSSSPADFRANAPKKINAPSSTAGQGKRKYFAKRY